MRSPLLLGAALLTLVAIAATPLAAAQEDPYLLRVSVYRPEAPHASDGAEDCGKDRRPGSTAESGLALLRPFLTPPATINGVSHFTPRCVAMLAVCPHEACAPVPRAYASWDVASGAYYAEAHVPGSGIPLPFPVGLATSTTHAVGGRGPVGITADCEQCPPMP